MKSTLPILAAVCLSLAIRPANAQVPFTLSTSLTNGANFVQSVTTTDVNGDGRLDLICIRANPSILYVWTNGGNGIFVSNASYAVGSFPYQVIAVDVNNDGKPDLITANNSGKSLTVLTNDGTGNFVLASTLPLGTPSAPHAVAAGDLNGDGLPDLISANSQSASFTVWTNSGGGIFVSNATYIVGTGGTTVPSSVTTADVNGDGKLDVIGVCTGSGTLLRVWTNNGVGGLVPSSFNAPIAVQGISSVTTADINRDGKPDLILDAGELSGSGVMVLTGNGDGTFSLGGFTIIPNNPYAVVAADVNGDGYPDAMTPNQGNNTLTVLTNNGSGILGSNTTFSVGSGPQSIAAADVSGDGRVDLITGNWNSGSLTVVTNASTFLPKLFIKRIASSFIVSWPSIWPNWSLQQITDLKNGAWLPYPGTVGNDGTTKTATNTSATAAFFRLSNP